jgi:hypothetical protein
MDEYITELANDIAKSCPDLVENGCGNDNCVACLAFKLIGLGYQKQSNTADVVPQSDLDLLKSLITHKEEEAYNKGYEDAKADILEKLQADIERDETLAEYGDELFEGRIAGFKAVINYLNAEGEK